MKEHQILFIAPMVRALLAGRKMQTRRAFSARMIKLMSAAASVGEVSRFMEEGVLHKNDLPYIQQFSPYGQPGDRLWVREAWRSYASLDDIPPRAIAPGAGVQYEAGGSNLRLDHLEGMGKYRPSMFMPRWASRITLEVVSVRVELLQDISRGDAMDEGCPFPNMAQGDDPRKWYAKLWESINGDGSWEANPWVWVVEVKTLKCS